MDIFYCHLEYFTDIWHILRTFGIFYDHLVHFVFIWHNFLFWYHGPRKIWQPWSPCPVLTPMPWMEYCVGHDLVISPSSSSSFVDPPQAKPVEKVRPLKLGPSPWILSWEREGYLLVYCAVINAMVSGAGVVSLNWRVFFRTYFVYLSNQWQ
jgi:hypothetical protein